MEKYIVPCVFPLFVKAYRIHRRIYIYTFVCICIHMHPCYPTISKRLGDRPNADIADLD